MKDHIFGQAEFEPRSPDEYWKVGSLTFGIWMDTQKIKIQREIRDLTGETKYSNAIPLEELETLIEVLQKIVTKRALEQSWSSLDRKSSGLFTRFFGKKKAPEKLKSPKKPEAEAQLECNDGKQLDGSTAVFKGSRRGEKRATFILNEELVERVKAAAYWERRPIKDFVDEALEEYLKSRGN
jgi:hypothetical protein